MEKRKQPPVIVNTFTDGTVECIFDEEHHGQVIAYLSQAMCGAFDVAGEHEAEVRNTLTIMARQMAYVLRHPEE